MDCRENENYIGRRSVMVPGWTTPRDYFQLLLYQVHYPHGAGECLNTLLSQNKGLLVTHINERTISDFKDQISIEGMNKEFLHFFGGICCYGDEPMFSNQQLLLKSLIYDIPACKKFLIQHYVKPYKPTSPMPVQGNPAQFPANWEQLQNCYKQVYVFWQGTENWSEADRANLFYSPRAGELRLDCVPEKIAAVQYSYGNAQSEAETEQLLVPVENLCWVLEPNRLKNPKIRGRTSLLIDIGTQEAIRKTYLRDLANYFVAQMDMFADMCLGRSYTVVREFRNEFSYGLLMSMMLRKNLPYTLQAAYAKLILRLWIDSFPHEENCGHPQLPKLLWIYSEVNDTHPRDIEAFPQFRLMASHPCYNDPDEFLNYHSSTKFDLIKNLFMDFTSAEMKNGQSLRDREKNLYFLSLLQILKKLLSYGFCSKFEELRDLVGVLIKALSSQDDAQGTVPHDEDDEHGSLDIADCSKIIMSCKTLICEALVKVESICANYRINKFIFGFHRAQSMKDAEFMSRSRSIKSTSHRMSLSLNASLSWKYLKLEDAEPVHPEDIFDDIFSSEDGKSLDFNSNSEVPLDLVLFELLLNESNDLFVQAFRLFQSNHGEKAGLLGHLSQVQLLPSDEIPLYGSFELMELDIRLLRNYINIYREWGVTDEFSGQDVNCFKSVYQILDGIKKFLLYPGPQSTSIRVHMDEDPLINFKELLRKPINNNHQDLFFFLGVHQVLLSLTMIEYGNAQSNQQQSYTLRGLVRVALGCISLLVKYNTPIQDAVFPALTGMTELMENDPSLGAEFVFMETLRDNTKLCEKADEKIFKTFAHQLAATRNPDLLEFFTLAIAPKGKAISRNQVIGISELISKFNLRELMNLLTDGQVKPTDAEIPQQNAPLKRANSEAIKTKALRPAGGSQNRLGKMLHGNAKSQRFLKATASFTAKFSKVNLGRTNKAEYTLKKMKSPEQLKTLSFWMHLLRICALCTKGRENLIVMGKLQKMLPSQFLVEAIDQILNPADLQETVNRDLLLSLIQFLNDVYLDTQLEEYRLIHDRDLRRILARMADYVVALDMSGQASLEDFELMSDHEREVLLGIGITSCLSSYLTITLKGNLAAESASLYQQLAIPLGKIAHNSSLNREARFTAFQALVQLKERIEPDILQEFENFQVYQEKELPFSKVDDVQKEYQDFVKKIQNSPRIKDDMKEEKIEMVDLLEYAEFITNPSAFSSSEQLLNGEECPENVASLMETSKKLQWSKVITLEDLLVRMSKFLVESLQDEDKMASCVSVFEILSLMLARKFDRVKEIQSKKFLTIEEKEQAEESATTAYVELQNLFGKVGLIDAVYNAIMFSAGNEVGIAAFQLGKEMLNEGNITVQERMLEYMKTTDVNGVFFLNIRNLLRDAVDQVKESRQTKKYYPDFYQPPASAFEQANSLFGFMQQLCEGQFIEMQKALLFQPFNRKSYNLIEESIRVAVTFAKDRALLMKMTNAEVETVGSALSLLIEVTLGPCPPNQMFIAGSQIVEVCDFLITTPEFPNITKPEIGFDTRQKACALLAACLENRADIVVEKTLAAKLNTNIINEACVELYGVLQKLLSGESLETPVNEKSFIVDKHDEDEEPGMSKEELEEFACECLDFSASYLFFIRGRLYLLDHLKDVMAPPKKTDELQAALHEAYTGFLQRLGYVEISWNGQIEIMYFPMPSEAASLTLSTMQDFETSADLETQDSRVKSLMGAVDGFLDEMMVLDGLKTNLWYSFIKTHFETIQYFVYFISVCINILVVFGVTGTTVDSMRSPAATGLLIFLSAIAMLGYLNMMLFFIASQYQLVWRRLSRDYKNGIESDLEPQNFTDYSHLVFWAVSLFGYILVCSIICIAFAELGKTLQGCVKFAAFVFPYTLVQSTRATLIIPCNVITRYFCACYDVFFNGKVFGNFLLLACSILGYFNVFFYTLMLCNIVTLSEDANNVLIAATKPGRALLVTGVLFIIVILIFATLGFILYGTENFCEGGDCEMPPRNLYDTFWLVLDGGIRSGDIGGLMTGTSHEDAGTYHQRIFFMLGFFIIIGALLFNMVTGIIVDTFSSLREDTMARNEKMQSEAFISGISRETYDEVGLKFEDLTDRDQYIWNYVYFLLYLRKKDKSDLTGAERHVLSSIASKDNNWFPIFKSFQLQQVSQGGEEGPSVEDQIAETNLKIDKATDKMQQTDEKIDKLSMQLEVVMSMINTKSK